MKRFALSAALCALALGAPVFEDPEDDLSAAEVSRALAVEASSPPPRRTPSAKYRTKEETLRQQVIKLDRQAEADRIGGDDSEAQLALVLGPGRRAQRRAEQAV